MQSLQDTEIVGFVELKVGSLAVQVPIRRCNDPSVALFGRASGPKPTGELPLASFETEGDAYAILVRGDTASKAVATALQHAAHDAVRHLSRKLLN
jgi:hypothetical protein